MKKMKMNTVEKKLREIKNSDLPETVILDKGLVRRIYEHASRQYWHRPPTDLQIESIQAFDLLNAPPAVFTSHSKLQIC